MLLRVGAAGEEAGRLDHDVDAEVAPRKVRRVALGEALHFLAADVQRAAGDFDRLGEPPEHGVVPEQVRHRLQVAEVVERDDLEVAAPLVRRPEEVAADPAESIDPYACFRHGVDSSQGFRLRFGSCYDAAVAEIP